MTHGGVVISADDYFRDDSGKIRRKSGQLQRSHVWARQRGKPVPKTGFLHSRYPISHNLSTLLDACTSVKVFREAIDLIKLDAN